MDNKEKSPEQELIESIGLMIEKGMESNTNIYTGVVKSVDGKRAVVTVNGQNQNVSIATADVSSGNVVRVFVPEGNMSAAFIIKAEASGGTTTTAYGDLTGKPRINGVTLVDNKTSKELNLYGTGNEPSYPVTSVNGQTGDVTISAGGNVDSVNGKTGVVVLTQDDVGDGTTYVRTHNDFTNALKAQINTNEDNIAMAESDIDGLQTDVGMLKTNVTNIQTALTSKQDVIVGAASTITEDNLATDRALVSNSSGKVAVSNVTSTELGYLDGVTGNIQTQLNNKLEKAPVTSVNNKTGAVQLNASDVGALPDTTIIPSKTSQLDNDSGFIVDIPIASTTQLGGVKIGAGLSVTENGTLSATGGGTADAVEWNNVLNKPTTIAGYGITDAKIENGTITLGNQTITPLTSAPVTSVNSKTGVVVLEASDVGAATTSDIHTMLNRNNAVNVANSNYTTYMARGEALFSSETTPTVNGTIAWQYE